MTHVALILNINQCAQNDHCKIGTKSRMGLSKIMDQNQIGDRDPILILDKTKTKTKIWF